jgi:hypothetical protein
VTGLPISLPMVVVGTLGATVEGMGLGLEDGEGLGAMGLGKDPRQVRMSSRRSTPSGQRQV